MSKEEYFNDQLALDSTEINFESFLTYNVNEYLLTCILFILISSYHSWTYRSQAEGYDQRSQISQFDESVYKH
jgi:hypothetical protein